MLQRTRTDSQSRSRFTISVLSMLALAACEPITEEPMGPGNRAELTNGMWEMTMHHPTASSACQSAGMDPRDIDETTFISRLVTMDDAGILIQIEDELELRGDRGPTGFYVEGSMPMFDASPSHEPKAEDVGDHESEDRDEDIESGSDDSIPLSVVVEVPVEDDAREKPEMFVNLDAAVINRNRIEGEMSIVFALPNQTCELTVAIDGAYAGDMETDDDIVIVYEDESEDDGGDDEVSTLEEDAERDED